MTIAELVKELEKFDQNEQVGIYCTASGDWAPISLVDRTVETICTNWNGKVITIWPVNED